MKYLRRASPKIFLLAVFLLSFFVENEAEKPSYVVVPLHRPQVHKPENPENAENDSLGTTTNSRKTTNLGKLTVGGQYSPKQEFDVLFDTGSAHTVLPARSCVSPSCLAHRRYDFMKSSTGRAVNADGSPVLRGESRDEMTVYFGSGMVHGDIVEEKVCLGGLCTRQSILAASNMSDSPFLDFPFDGVVGLGLEKLSVAPGFNFLTQLFNEFSGQGSEKAKWHLRGSQNFQESEDHFFKSASKMFAMHLAVDQSPNQNGELTLGGWRREKIRHEFNDQTPAWVKLSKPEMGHWQIQIKNIYVGNIKLNLCEAAGVVCSASVDSGSGLFGVPVASVSEVISAFGEHHVRENLCEEDRMDMPDFIYEIKSQTKKSRNFYKFNVFAVGLYPEDQRNPEWL